MEYALSIGSNLGDRLEHLRQARRHIAALEGVTLLGVSPVYETEPVDVAPPHSDHTFLNTVLIMTSDTAPEIMARQMHTIEAALGRLRSGDRNAPRTIDIDMIYAGNCVIDAAGLRLPHMRWHERRFVVQPLADLRPDRILPGETRSVAMLLKSLPERPTVALFARDW